ncbi:MAG: NfeD family protein [Bacteroidales bacterium]|nr:NfeD family protein [Bacteroidales bacterium]
MGVIILLIVLGILLFLIEFLLIPGITIAGIGGALLTVAGVYMAFDEYGTRIGVLVLLFTLISSLVIFAFSLRAKTWKKAVLNTNIDGNVSDDMGLEHIHEGDRGETIGRLAPMGKIRVNSHVFEAKSQAGYIDPHVPVEVIKVHGSQIIVKPIK